MNDYPPPTRWRRVAEALATDVRLGARSLLRASGFSTLGVLVLGLGIAAASLSFTLIQAVLLEPLPYERPSELYQVSLRLGERGDIESTVVPIVMFRAWREAAAHVAQLVASDEARQPATMYLSGTTRPDVVRGAFVSSDWFDVLGVSVASGRSFAGEQTGAPVAVISHELWQRTFDGEYAAIGRSIRVNGQPFTIIGILPREFIPPPPVWQVGTAETIEAWAPMAAGGTPPIARTPSIPAVDHDRVLARVTSGVSVHEAEAELVRIARQHAPDVQLAGLRLVPLRTLVIGDASTPLAMLAAIVTLTLLLVCANIAGLQLTRFSKRRREAAIRAALGATRARVTAHFMTEGIVLALAGGTTGLLLATWLQDAMRVLAPAGLRRVDNADVDFGVAAFTLGLAGLAGLFANAWPAIAATTAYHDVSRGGTVTDTRRQRAAQNCIATAQIVIALALLAGTGALARSVQKLGDVDIGIPHLDALVIDLHRRTDAAGAVAPRAFYDETLRHVRALPGVAAAALTSSVPFRPRDYVTPDARRRIVSDGYFETLGIPVIAGRAFDASDHAGAQPVVVLSRALAARAFDGADAVGRTYDDARVIGVVKDVRHESADSPAEPAYYVPLAQARDARLSLIVRARAASDELPNEVREVIAKIDPEQPVTRMTTLRDVLGASPALSRRSFQLDVLLGVAAFAIILAAMGVYGVVAQTVEQRTPEIGMRVALGASRRDVLSLVFSGVARLIAAGVFVGVLAGIGFVRLLARALFGVQPVDSPSLAAAVLLISAVAFIAAAWPARRALRVDPAQTLQLR